jgi:hypothetical protein
MGRYSTKDGKILSIRPARDNQVTIVITQYAIMVSISSRLTLTELEESLSSFRNKFANATLCWLVAAADRSVTQWPTAFDNDCCMTC